eukprot:g4430.t1
MWCCKFGKDDVDESEDLQEARLQLATVRSEYRAEIKMKDKEIIKAEETVALLKAELDVARGPMDLLRAELDIARASLEKHQVEDAALRVKCAAAERALKATQKTLAETASDLEVERMLQRQEQKQSSSRRGQDTSEKLEYSPRAIEAVAADVAEALRQSDENAAAAVERMAAVTRAAAVKELEEAAGKAIAPGDEAGGDLHAAEEGNDAIKAAAAPSTPTKAVPNGGSMRGEGKTRGKRLAHLTPARPVTAASKKQADDLIAQHHSAKDDLYV